MEYESRRGNRNQDLSLLAINQWLRKVRAPRWSSLLGNSQCG
ncbi:hypothetical protein EV05_0287 [Prochlorococcus sp. MIT 0601]|nr:hypothetical protein EV05_0287 [Prochlorococcus sp. MIT 0601]